MVIRCTFVLIVIVEVNAAATIAHHAERVQNCSLADKISLKYCLLPLYDRWLEIDFAYKQNALSLPERLDDEHPLQELCRSFLSRPYSCQAYQKKTNCLLNPGVQSLHNLLAHNCGQVGTKLQSYRFNCVYSVLSQPSSCNQIAGMTRPKAAPVSLDPRICRRVAAYARCLQKSILIWCGRFSVTMFQKTIPICKADGESFHTGAKAVDALLDSLSGNTLQQPYPQPEFEGFAYLRKADIGETMPLDKSNSVVTMNMRDVRHIITESLNAAKDSLYLPKETSTEDHPKSYYVELEYSGRDSSVERNTVTTPKRVKQKPPKLRLPPEKVVTTGIVHTALGGMTLHGDEENSTSLTFQTAASRHQTEEEKTDALKISKLDSHGPEHSFFKTFEVEAKTIVLSSGIESPTLKRNYNNYLLDSASREESENDVSRLKYNRVDPNDPASGGSKLGSIRTNIHELLAKEVMGTSVPPLSIADNQFSDLQASGGIIFSVISECSEEKLARMRYCVLPSVSNMQLMANRYNMEPNIIMLYAMGRTEAIQACETYASSFIDCTIDEFLSCSQNMALAKMNSILGFACANIIPFLDTFTCIKDAFMTNNRCHGTYHDLDSTCSSIIPFIACASPSVSINCGHRASGFLTGLVKYYGC